MVSTGGPAAENGSKSTSNGSLYSVEVRFGPQGPGALRICHVTSGFTGGVYHAVRQWANWQAERGFSVTVVHDTFWGHPSSLREDFHPEIDLVPWGVCREISPRSDIRSLWALMKAIKTAKPSLVHLHSSKAGALGRLACRLLGLPSVYSPHCLAVFRKDVSVFKRMVFYALEYVGAIVGDISVGCSVEETQVMSRWPSRVFHIPNGIDLSEIDSVMTEPRQIDLSPAEFRIAIVGRVTAAKNPNFVVSVANESPEGWRFTWAGAGELLDDVGASPRVECLGFRTRRQVLQLVHESDVLLHLARWEGMPLAVLEAMALRRPVVALDTPSLAALVRHGRTGFLVTDKAHCLEALHTLWAKPDLRERMGEQARGIVKRDHSIGALNERWLRLYIAVMRHHGEGQTPSCL